MQLHVLMCLPYSKHLITNIMNKLFISIFRYDEECLMIRIFGEKFNNDVISINKITLSVCLSAFVRLLR